MKITTRKNLRLFKDFFLDALAASIAVTLTMKWYELKKLERHVPTWELFLIILSIYAVSYTHLTLPTSDLV